MRETELPVFVPAELAHGHEPIDVVQLPFDLRALRSAAEEALGQ